jgi:hypothetical protein
MFKRKTLNVDVDVNTKINTVEVQDRISFDLRTKNGMYTAKGNDAGLTLSKPSGRQYEGYRTTSGWQYAEHIQYLVHIPVESLDAVIGLLAAARDKYNQAPEVTPEVVE